MMRKEAKIGVLLVFAVFLWYLLAQYSSVYIYYDDYGYLSLSYGYRVQGVTGLGYTPAQMLEFVQGHYASGSSGRLLYMLIFLTVYMLAGLRGVQVFMALAAEAVLVLSFMLAWRFLDKKPERGLASLAVPVLMAAVPGILFGLIGVIVQRSGSYWYAASFLYVVPAIAFCLFAMAYYRTAVEEEESRTWKKAGCAVLAFLAAFSQEQWMVAAVVLAAGVMVLRRLSGKRLRGWDWCTLAAAVAGTLPILTSPGAERRLQQHTWFLEMSWLERIVMNIGLITRTFFSSDNQLYTLFLLMAMGCLGVYMAARRITAIGNLAQNFIGLSTWTDALRTSSFPQNWTIFYWAYWMVWCVATPFFIGSISKGRTVRQTVLGGYFWGLSGTFTSFIILGNYGLHLQVSGAMDLIGSYQQTGDLYQIIITVMNSLPLPQLGLVLLALSMIAFYATSFDALTIVAAAYSYKKLPAGAEPHRNVKLYWAVVLMLLPIALIFSENSMNNLQTVSIIAAFPIGIVILLILASFFKDARQYLKEKEGPAQKAEP